MNPSKNKAPAGCHPSSGWFKTAIATLFFGLLPSLPAQADLVVLANGGVLKVRSFVLQGEQMRLELWDGGGMTLSVTRIERIVDDEVIPQDPADPEPEAMVAPMFPLHCGESAKAPATPYGELILAAGKKHNLNPELLAAIARAESAFDVRALSVKGARGLLQLMPATAERFGVSARRLYEPASNLEAASRYLRFLIGQFDGELPLVLAAYNAGEGAVRKYGGVPPYRETRAYVGRIYQLLGLSSEHGLALVPAGSSADSESPSAER